MATIKEWNVKAYEKYSMQLQGDWYIVSNPSQLTTSYLKLIQPSYIFFPHWSWIVPREITAQYNCVCFHMTDVPYGRGGSPLQNLIVRGHKKTKITALKMVDGLDAGPVYGKIDLSLEGSAQEIFERAANKVYELIDDIVKNNPQPTEQFGDVVKFQRRTPEQSELPKHGNLDSLYDHIRMLDADGYPRAFIEYGDFRLELSHAEKQGDEVTCRLVVRRDDDGR